MYGNVPTLSPVEAQWESPAEVKAQYGNASIVGNNRIVFNIAGNKYRLIVAFAYRTQIAYVKFVGTHAEYDKIDAIRGMNITISTTAKTDDEAKALLSAFKFPFRN